MPRSARSHPVNPADVVNFDEVLPHIGEMGPYQLGLFLLMCIPATLPAAFLAFNQVFLSAEPDHWCKVDALSNFTDSSGRGLSLRHIKALSVPTVNLGPEWGNVTVYKRCSQYDVNFTDIFVQNGNKWPRRANPDWPVSECKEGWSYDRSEFVNTLVTELDLVCDKSWWPSTSTALFYVGSLFGNILFGLIADRYGRRTSFFCLLFMEISISIVTCFAPNYVAFTVLRTINGFTFPAIFQVPFILTLEMMGPGYHTFVGMMICLFFAVALMILAGLAYVFNSWFNLALITSVPFVFLFSYWWIVPESPRWLLSYGRLDEAEVIVQSIAKWNRKPIKKNFLKDFVERRKALNAEKEVTTPTPTPTAPDSPQTAAQKKRAEKTPSMFVVFLHYPKARRNFMLITFNWFANALVYNGLSFYSANLNVNSFLGFFISAAVEVPSYLIGWYVMDKWGRRWILFATMTTGGIAEICCMFVPQTASPWITVVLAMIGKFQIAASFAVIYVYAGELMPTVVRSEAMGISSFVAGLGLLVFPYINSLGAYVHVLPLVIMGTLSVMGGITALFLPETLFTHLPNTLEEGESFGSDFKVCSCPHKGDEDEEEVTVNADSVELKGTKIAEERQQLNGKAAAVAV